MNDRIEELMPVLARLADRFTSKESTSVSYDTAQQLMEAVLYCIEECEGERQGVLLAGDQIDYMAAYEEGYRIAYEKVLQAKKIYHQIVAGFEDFKCKNYRDTIIRGMPVFFEKYDVRFAPQNHILSLDYPVLNLNPDRKGIDLILEYLEQIAYEQRFLKHFSRKGIMDLLEHKCVDYRELFLENICEPVLLRGAACLAADMPVYDLKLDKEGKTAAKKYLMEDSAENPAAKLSGGTTEHQTAALERKLSILFDILEKNIMKADYRGIFKNCAHESAVRLVNIENISRNAAPGSTEPSVEIL